MLYPLRFEPIFRRYIWGGRRLADVLHKPIGDKPCAESWEIVDHDADQSIVKYGPLRGQPLAEVINRQGEELLGARAYQVVANPAMPSRLHRRFPLLLKFLDANRDLSVQVHPDDALASSLTPPDFGKTEAWYVMHADPGARIYAGLQDGITTDQFREAIAAGNVQDTLHSFCPKTGDCVFIRAGTVHAIGAGLLIAEIQQASDTTFRLFDWNRVDADGMPRELHVEQGIQAIDFNLGPVNPQTPTPIDHADSSCRIQTLVDCDKFVMQRRWLEQPVEIGGDGRFHILAVVNGSFDVASDPGGNALLKGDTMLLPATMEPTTISAIDAGELLDIFLPNGR